MIPKKLHTKVQAELQAYLSVAFGEVTVRIGEDIHYKGTNLVITSPVFKGLFPEQRFHHVVRAVPPEFYDRYLRSGVVWFELAPGESATDLMKMPRSDDVAVREDEIVRRLGDVDFAQKLESKLDGRPERASVTDFRDSRRILAKAGLSEEEVTSACLLLIRRGAFCDAQVVADVLPKLAV
ncbi:MAG: hypothetical protein ABII12_09070 [Planctomycetota bacterium]